MDIWCLYVDISKWQTSYWAQLWRQWWSESNGDVFSVQERCGDRYICLPLLFLFFSPRDDVHLSTRVLWFDLLKKSIEELISKFTSLFKLPPPLHPLYISSVASVVCRLEKMRLSVCTRLFNLKQKVIWRVGFFLGIYSACLFFIY